MPVSHCLNVTEFNPSINDSSSIKSLIIIIISIPQGVDPWPNVSGLTNAETKQNTHSCSLAVAHY